MQYSYSLEFLFEIENHEIVMISNNKGDFTRVRIAFYNHTIFRYTLVVLGS